MGLSINKNRTIHAYEYIELYRLPDNSTWLPVYYHDSQKGTVTFSSLSEGLNTSGFTKFSRLGIIQNGGLKDTSGKWEYLLRYPLNDPNKYNRWTQTSLPNATTASGYTAVHVDWSTSFGALKQWNTTSTYMSCSTDTNWFYAIAPIQGWQGSNPGPYNAAGEITCLYVRYDTLANKAAVKFFKNTDDTSGGGDMAVQGSFVEF